MKIAVMGMRGIPARYGGFENFAEELSVRLAQRGHEVAVYCCSRHCPERNRRYRGVKRVMLPALSRPMLEPMTHTAIGDAGLYYRFNNITDLSQKIRDAVHQPDDFQSFRAKAQERVDANYSWEMVADRYETLFRSMAC
ncbi:MAG TPA: glycosyltransferase [Acidobacteriota bacterium]|jgi:hypothetical protein|nr:glycosyltransferase [Acidobacteriota bacterium]